MIIGLLGALLCSAGLCVLVANGREHLVTGFVLVAVGGYLFLHAIAGPSTGDCDSDGSCKGYQGTQIDVPGSSGSDLDDPISP
jgi:hypothetical protein